MAASMVKFLFGFSVVVATVYVFFKLLPWVLRFTLGATVSFRSCGWNCLKGVVVKLKKGSIESMSVGEIKLSLCQSFKICIRFISWDPKLLISICDLEVVMRTSNSRKGSCKTKTWKRSRGGKRKLMVLPNIARFFSVSMTNMVVKTPKATTEIKELELDLSKNRGSEGNFAVKLSILPIFVQIGKSQVISDHSSEVNGGRSLSANQSAFNSAESSSPSLFCQKFSLSCEFGHDRQSGASIKNVEVNFGDVTVSLNEKLLSENKTSPDASHTDKVIESSADSAAAKKPPKQPAIAALSKHASKFPEKVCFSLSTLDVRIAHQEHNFTVENSIKGFQMKSTRSQSTEDVGESVRFDALMEFREIHLLRDAGSSILEITKVDVVSKIFFPIQPSSTFRAEVETKLGSTVCNLMVTRFKPLLSLHFSKKKKMVLQEESSTREKPWLTDSRAPLIMWKGAVLAPEITIVLCSVSDSPMYRCCSQSLNVTANNISSTGTAVEVELSELDLHMVDEHQECLKESLFGIKSSPGSLINIQKVRLNWGKKDGESSEEVDPKTKLSLSVDVSTINMYISLNRVESLLVNALSFKALMKSLSSSVKRTAQNRGVRTSKSSGKGPQLLKLNVESCSVNFSGDTDLDKAVIEDPKHVNYGSQGGRFVVSVSADGTPRTASIMSTLSEDCRRLKYSLSFEAFQFCFTLNKEKESMQVEVERARSIYREYLGEPKEVSRVTLFDIKNAKLVRRNGGLKEIAICSLFSASSIAVRWEPDAHISMVELVLHLKSLVHTKKLQQQRSEQIEDATVVREAGQKEEETTISASVDKHKKKESIFAVDVEMLSISAEAGDGVEAEVQVQSIFSENARIGLLLEGLTVGFCGSRIFKSSRMQISRIPSMPATFPNAAATTGVPWDWVIQGLDIYICMPFRLQLRAIDDAVEEMLRALKLIIAAKTKLIFLVKEESSKPRKSSSSKFGRVRFCFRRFVFGIEEEPLQGWLDEHYHLMRKEARELAIRLNFLDEFISRANQLSKNAVTDESTSERKACFDGAEIDIEDPSNIQIMREKIYKQSFQSYYEACQSFVPSEGSGACKEGFQAGFKPSAARSSLFSISATNLNLSLTAIEGGEAGMIEVIKKLDPVCQENDIPFSRLYGSNIQLNTDILAAQIRNYTFPLLSTTSGKCEGRVVLGQQATYFQPQIVQDVYVGRWRKVQMLRSASGTTPGMKTYFDLPIYFQKGEVSFGVGYEPVFADISYAFTVALRRANLSLRGPGLPQPPKKEKSLPWWDEMRNYIHGNITLFFSETKWIVLATPDPYEKLDKLQMSSASMEIQQSDGRIYTSAKDLKIYMSSLESLTSRHLKFPTNSSGYPFLEVPSFCLEVKMDWDCDSGNPLNHYLFALPNEGRTREFIYDPFRSTSLSLCWDFSFRPKKLYPSVSTADQCIALPIINFGAHDLAWLIKFWNMNYLPPYKLRTFSRWPRFGVPRIPRSGNLSMDRVMTEFMLRLDTTPIYIKHMPLDDDNPARGLTFNMTNLKYEIFFSRGKQKFTFECKRDPLDPVYQGLDLHMPKAFLNRDDPVLKTVQMTMTGSQSGSVDGVRPDNCSYLNGCNEEHPDDGFLFSSDYFTIRRQAPKAEPKRLLAWKEAGRRNREMMDKQYALEKGSESDKHAQSGPSDDDGYNVVIADNCQRIFVYGLKLLWNIENRDAILSFVGGLSKAFAPPKPSPSRQYAQRKLLEEKQKHFGEKILQDDPSKPPTSESGNFRSQHMEPAEMPLSSSDSVKTENLAPVPVAIASVDNESLYGIEEEGTRHFMVNVIEPQFNLHSEEANGRFLLAAASGRVLARSFHSVVRVGYDIIERAAGTENNHNPESGPEMTWRRMELSVMLEHVQAHVAPTDVDPGAGVQWLPKIRRSSPKAKRTGALLERVFMPCDMYFQYTRHKGVTPDFKVKPLKELTFNSHNITASMTSRQFQVMLDVLTNLLFARLPKLRTNSLLYLIEEDDDIEEEIDEAAPDGVEEVELAKIDLEQKERERMLLLDDIKELSQNGSTSGDQNAEKEGEFWMIARGRSLLVQGLKKALVNAQKSRKAAYAALRTAVQKAAELQLLDKDKNRSPSSAMRISLQISKVVWSMLLDGKTFAEVEIDNMIYDFNRDYKDVGVAQFTTRYFVLRNCLPNAKSDTVLSPWNPPPEWGKKVMLRVDTKQGAPRDGQSPFELFQVEIYPLKIYLTETMYRMMWEYLFPGEEQHSQRREEVWKVSTTAGTRRLRKGSLLQEASGSPAHSTKDNDGSSRLGSASFFTSDSAQASKVQNPKSSSTCSSSPELRRTSSFDRTWEETVAESVANELLSSIEQQNASSRNKLKDSRTVKGGRTAYEERKVEKSQEEKKPRPQKIMEFQNIKISQVELLITYEGSRFAVSDLKLLMDTFHRVEFTGTWRRLFSRVKKHVIWGVLKSVTGMQVKKFKDKAHGRQETPDKYPTLVENEKAGNTDQYPVTWVKRPGDGAGDSFVTSIKGIFNTQRREAKKFVLRTMRGEAEDNSYPGEWSDNEAEFSPFARQLTITKARKLIRHHSKKFNSKPQKGSKNQEAILSPPKETAGYESDSSSGTSAYEEFLEQNQL